MIQGVGAADHAAAVGDTASPPRCWTWRLASPPPYPNIGAAAPSTSAGVSQRMSAPLTTSATTPTADAGRTSKPPAREANTHDVVTSSKSKSPPNTYVTDPPSMPPPPDATLRTFGVANRSTNACTPPPGSLKDADVAGE